MKRPILLGHRGARIVQDTPENTLASFELCLQHGCDGFEFDVRRSGDGVAVVCHDPIIRGLAIERTLAADLELPAFFDVVSGFAGRAFLDIELKVAGLEMLVVRALRDCGARRGVVVSSFLPQVLTAMHDLAPDIPRGLICEDAGQLSRWLQLPVEWLIPRVDLTDQMLIEQVHTAGRKIMVWTINEEAALRKFAAWAVDAIITDDTLLAPRILAEAGSI